MVCHTLMEAARTRWGPAVPKTLHLADAAERLGVHPITLRRWLLSGKIRGIAKDRNGWWMFEPEDIRRGAETSPPFEASRWRQDQGGRGHVLCGDNARLGVRGVREGPGARGREGGAGGRARESAAEGAVQARLARFFLLIERLYAIQVDERAAASGSPLPERRPGSTIARSVAD
jgi:hypothetical protein